MARTRPLEFAAELSAGGRWIRTIGTPPNFVGRPSIPAQFTFRNINRLPRDRDRWFKSISLQRTAAILSPFCYRCPVGKSFPSCDVQCLASSMELADANLTGKPAAMIIEPVMSAGGIVVPPPGYVKLLKEYCRERGMLLIMDESQTGLGKTGKYEQVRSKSCAIKRST